MKKAIFAGCVLALVAGGAAQAGNLSGSLATIRADVVKRADCKMAKETFDLEIFHCTSDDTNWYLTKPAAPANPAAFRFGVKNKDDNDSMGGPSSPFGQLRDKVVFMEVQARAPKP
jgi:hypothetical protein